MILSMTGFGKKEVDLNGKNYLIELRSLNSKGIEFRTKLPDELRHKELELRKIVQDYVIKGKIDLTISTGNNSEEDDYILDKNLLKDYCKQLSEINDELHLNGDVLQAAMKLPSVFKPVQQELSDTDWEKLETAVREVLEIHKNYRTEEGAPMFEALLEYTNNILKRVDVVQSMDTDRIERIRQRYKHNFEKIARDVSANPNRMELEIIYYLEKLDFSEEIVRLVQHCEYLLKEIKGSEISKGRKLNFITQEMGREINTLGAKAYDSEIQKEVVEMKDDLEKIKEQTANIL